VEYSDDHFMSIVQGITKKQKFGTDFIYRDGLN